MPIKTRWFIFLLLSSWTIISLPRPALAVELIPFATRNQSPLIQIYGLPTPEPAALLEKGQFSTGLVLDVANNFSSSSTTGESVLLDGETYRTNLSLRYGLRDRFELGIDLPYISHAGGFLDGFIDDFHDFFGLPDGGRPQAPKDRLDYNYRRNGKDLVDLTGNAHGFGDLRLSVGWQLLREAGPSPGSAALRVSLKLPTGDSDQLLGSGSTDLALSLTGQREYPLENGRFSAYASLGALFMTDGEVLEDQRRNLAGFGSLGLGWAPLEWLALKIQADGHTAMYKDSNLEEIDSLSIQLVMGGTLQLAETTSLDLAIGEDIMVGTSPDVVFHFGLRTIF